MLLQLLFLAAFAVFSAAQTPATQPTVSAIENNYSYILPGLPNYGIAQGSIFVIFGNSLASTSSGLQSVPLSTTLDGVSVQVSVGGATTQALLYYVMPGQIAGILPSATPAGAGQIIVTNNGHASAPAPVTVVESAFGIAASIGFSPGSTAAFDSSWHRLNATNAANPGDTIAFFGTGAGPVSGNEAVQQTPRNLSNVPIEVDIGGIPAAVAYHGRSIYPGLDQINVVIPSGPVGCNVSLDVISSGIVSNFAFLPIASQGRTCSDQVPGVNLPLGLMISGENVINSGTVNLTRNVIANPVITANGMFLPAVNIESDVGSGIFQRFTAPGAVTLGAGANGVFPSLGNCAISSAQLPLPAAPSGAISTVSTGPGASTPPSLVNLNAGPSINFTGPNGKASAALEPSGTYFGALGGSGAGPNPLPLLIPAGGGTITIDNGSGGPDVGSFTTQVNVAPPLVWTNMYLLPPSISRSNPLTLAWTGGNPSGIVSISATSSLVNSSGILEATVSCNAPVSAGEFTIPSVALGALPPSSLTVVNHILPSTSISVQTVEQSRFSAPGLDAGLIEVQVSNTLTVPYQ